MSITPSTLTRRLLPLAGILAAIATALGGAAPAQAALSGTCNTSPLSQPFAPWGDSNTYELAPGGNFQNGAPGWQLSGGAKIVAGGDPYTAASKPMSIQLPAGATVQSPYACVNLSYPLFRFFARNITGASHIQVTILYNNLVLGILPLPVGTVTPADAWQPSAQLTTASLLGTLTSLGNAQVSIRFTATGGTAALSDVYIDPRCI